MAAPRRRGRGAADDRKRSEDAGGFAGVTFANGGDDIGVYVSVFATAGVGEMSVYAVAFLILVALWCFAGRFFATRPVIGSTQPAGRASDLLLF